MRREAWIWELVSLVSDAVSDVWAFGTSEVPDLSVDVTIAQPMAATYQPHAAETAGHAASAAEGRKAHRYPAAGGRVVTPFASETWGRLGAEAECLLQNLAAAASRHAAHRGQFQLATACLRRWRAALDAVAQRGVAMSLLSASNGLPGRAHRRTGWRLPAPLDM